MATDGQENSGAHPATTNNRMELQAIIEAMKAQPVCQPLLIQSDSQYAIKSLTEWIDRWKANGWKGSKKKAILNVDLIKEADALATARDVRFEWVKGHDGHPLNEQADRLANDAARGAVGP